MFMLKSKLQIKNTFQTEFIFKLDINYCGVLSDNGDEVCDDEQIAS